MSITKRNAVLFVLFVFLFGGFSLRFGDAIGFLDEAYLINFIQSFGIWGPIALMGLLVLEVVIAPLPGGVLPIAGAVIFGPVIGTLYAWIGNVIGSVIAFFLSQKYGDRIVRYFAPNFNLEQFNLTITNYRFGLWLLYATPGVPADILSFAFGLSSITFARFFRLISVAFLFRMSLWAIFGDALARLLFL